MIVGYLISELGDTPNGFVVGYRAGTYAAFELQIGIGWRPSECLWIVPGTIDPND